MSLGLSMGLVRMRSLRKYHQRILLRKYTSGSFQTERTFRGCRTAHCERMSQSRRSSLSIHHRIHTCPELLEYGCPARRSQPGTLGSCRGRHSHDLFCKPPPASAHRAAQESVAPRGWGGSFARCPSSPSGHQADGAWLVCPQDTAGWLHCWPQKPCNRAGYDSAGSD